MAKYRDDLIVLLVMVGGFLLNIYAPLWLAPPLFRYTTWLYLLVFFAWIPVYLRLMRGKRRGRLIALFIPVAVLVTCFGCILIRPRSAFAMGVFDTITCEPQPAVEGRVRYACTRQAFEGPQFNRAWVLEGIAGLPVIWIVEAEGW
jgi:hypothetical protein